MTFFFEQLSNGLVAGSTYALVALGFTLIFGVLKVLNVAHPDIYMWGAFCALSTARWGWPMALVALSAIVGASVWGVVIDRTVLHPLRNSAMVTPFIATVALSVFLENLAAMIYGPDPIAFPMSLGGHSLKIGGVNITPAQALTLGATIVMMVVLWYVVSRTWFGKTISATSENAEMASAVGINTGFVSMLTVVLGSGLAGAAGFLIALLYGQVWAFMGIVLGLKALIAMVVGGVGNIPGAVVAAFTIGILEAFAVGYLSSSYRDAIAFGVLVVVLVLRPQGLFGERLRTK